LADGRELTQLGMAVTDRSSRAPAADVAGSIDETVAGFADALLHAVEFPQLDANLRMRLGGS
jgi:hypothetical protein